MTKVAVRSALKHTSLEPYFLFDGEENELTGWLRQRGVTVIFRRSWLYSALSELAKKKDRENILVIGSGTFLRLEIPLVAQELGFADQTVLYTDCDILFLSEVVPQLSRLKPRFFSFAPEEDPNNNLEVNLGVMLINLPNLIPREAAFRRFVLRHLESCCDRAWDQTAYTWYYHPLMRKLLAARVPDQRAVRLCRALYRRHLGLQPLWDALPVEYNWKPYWDESNHAQIVHFHGPKPYEREMLSSPTPPAHLNHLLSMMGGSYNQLCDVWLKTLEEAES